MEMPREYYYRVISEYKSSRGRRSLRKYCQDEGIDYQWLMKSRKDYFVHGQPESDSDVAGTAEHFISLEIREFQKIFKAQKISLETLILLKNSAVQTKSDCLRKS